MGATPAPVGALHLELAEAFPRLPVRWSLAIRRARGPIRVGLTLTGVMVGLQMISMMAVPTDANAYWLALHNEPYSRGMQGMSGAFLYSPAFLDVFAPLGLLGEQGFYTAWRVMELVCIAWLAGPWTLLLLLTPPGIGELQSANIHALLAVAIVIGFRFPGAWGFVLLTKVTPGVGLLWFGVRREWRSLAIAFGATTVVLGSGLALAPGLWVEWFGLLLTGHTATDPGPALISVPFALRLPAALALITWGAHTDRRWVVPVGAMLALPAWWVAGLVMVAAVPRLRSAPGRPAMSWPRLPVRGAIHRQPSSRSAVS